MSTEVSFALSAKGPAFYDALLARLSQSRFRSRFHLGAADIELIGRKSLPVVREHAVRLLPRVSLQVAADSAGSPVVCRGG